LCGLRGGRTCRRSRRGSRGSGRGRSGRTRCSGRLSRTTGSAGTRKRFGLLFLVLFTTAAATGTAGLGFLLIVAVIRLIGVVPEALIALVEYPAAVLIVVFLERTSSTSVAQVVGLVIPIGKLELTFQLVTARHDRLL
jgi:hypothetical protein